MKRKFKQWWSIIPSIQKNRTITASHLNSLNLVKTTIYDVGNPGSGLGQTQKCDGIKSVSGFLPPLTGNTDIKKTKTIKKTTDSLPLIKTTHYHKYE
jgi:hypothetical protein